MKFFFPVMFMLVMRASILAQDNLEDSLPSSLFIQDTVQQDSIPAPSDTSSQPNPPADTIPQDTIPTTQSDTAKQIPSDVKEAINQRSMEIGLMFGEPTGVSYKYFITEANAVDAAAAVSFIPDAVFQLNADFLRHYYHFANVGNGRLPLTYGGGLAVQFRKDTRLGIRIPVGLTYIMQNFPIALFIDVAPRFDIVPDTEVSINAAVGIRYRFFPR